MISINEKSITFSNYGEKPKKISEDNLPYYLYDIVKIGKNVTFERIFDLIIKHKNLFNVIFGWGAMHGHEIDSFIEEYNKESTSTDLDYLEVFFSTDYWDFKDKKSKKEIEFYSGLHGIKKDEEFVYAIDFRPLNEIKKLPIKIKKNISFYDWVKVNEPKKLLEGEIEMKLFDFIGAILYEITWNGTPENRDERFDDLKERTDKIERGEEKFYELKTENGKLEFRELSDEENKRINDNIKKSNEKK
jgi:hypothetical protein